MIPRSLAAPLRASLRRTVNDARLSLTLIRHPFTNGRWCRRGQRAALRSGRRVWAVANESAQLHVAVRFIREVRRRHPRLGFVLSVPDRTARVTAERGLEHESDVVITYLPLPISPMLRRALSLIQPRSVVFFLHMNNYMTPNLAWLAKRRGIRVGAIGIEAQREYPRSLLYLAINGIHALCPRTVRDRDALVGAGFDGARMCVTGSPKFDATAPTEGRAEVLLRMIGVDTTQPVLVGGSIVQGEEVALLDVYTALRNRFPTLVLILVPRATRDAGAIVARVEERGLTPILRSRVLHDGAFVPGPDGPPVLVVDTLGELRSLYACATVVFVGRSLTRRSGSNLMEPAGHGKAIVVGPYFEDFQDELNAFLRADAIRQIADVDGLRRVVGELLEDADLREGYGRRARGVIAQHAGAMRRAVEYLETQGLW